MEKKDVIKTSRFTTTEWSTIQRAMEKIGMDYSNLIRISIHNFLSTKKAKSMGKTLTKVHSIMEMRTTQNILKVTLDEDKMITQAVYQLEKNIFRALKGDKKELNSICINSLLLSSEHKEYHKKIKETIKTFLPHRYSYLMKRFKKEMKERPKILVTESGKIIENERNLPKIQELIDERLANREEKN